MHRVVACKSSKLVPPADLANLENVVGHVGVDSLSNDERCRGCLRLTACCWSAIGSIPLPSSKRYKYGQIMDTRGSAV